MTMGFTMSSLGGRPFFLFAGNYWRISLSSCCSSSLSGCILILVSRCHPSFSRQYWMRINGWKRSEKMVNTFTYYAEKYLADEKSEDLENYMEAYTVLFEEGARPISCLRVYGEEEKYYGYLDLKRSLENILLLSEQAVVAKREADTEGAYEYGKN